MKKLLLLSFILLIAHAVIAQNTAWIKQLNEEENHLAAGSSRYYTVSKTPYASTNYTVRQFNASGTALLATTIFPGSPYTSMSIVKILATPSNELFILGYASYGSTTHGMLFKLTSSLLQSWQRILPAGPGLTFISTVDLALKGSDIVVLMKSLNSSGNSRAELRSISQSTGAIMIPGVTGTSHNNLTPLAIGVDGSQNVFICGQIGTTNGILLKYNSSLSQQWVNFFSRGNRTWFSNLAIDALGNCYVAGAGKTAATSAYSTIVRKYSSSGVYQSGYISSALTSGNYWSTVGFKIKITPGGDVLVGTSSNGVVQPRVMVYKFSSANLGTPVYAVTHLLPLSFWNFFMTGFEVTQGGKVFIVGMNVGTTNLTTNYVTAKIRANGTLEFTEVYNGGRCNAIVKAIPGTYPNDDFVTTGVISNINMLIKYTGPGLRLSDSNNAELNEVSSAFTIYPNPASSVITISPTENANHLSIFDMQGKQVLSEVINGTMQIQVGELPRGTYIVRIINDDASSTTQKLILQ